MNDQSTIECPKCKSTLANDDPSLFGKRVDCPKCSTTITLPRPSAMFLEVATSQTLSEKQLLLGIHDELIKSNKMLHTIWGLACIYLALILLDLLASLFMR